MRLKNSWENQPHSWYTCMRQFLRKLEGVSAKKTKCSCSILKVWCLERLFVTWKILASSFSLTTQRNRESCKKNQESTEFRMHPLGLFFENLRCVFYFNWVNIFKHAHAKDYNKYSGERRGTGIKKPPRNKSRKEKFKKDILQMINSFFF